MRNANFAEWAKSVAQDLSVLELSMLLVTAKLELGKEVESEIRISLALIGSIKYGFKEDWKSIVD